MPFFWKKSLPNALYCQTRLQQLPTIPVGISAYNILETPHAFHARVLELIEKAKERILITALYLENDETGREVMDALYRAKQNNPKLYIRVYVDFHRAQRGRIGEGESQGNASLYYKMAESMETPPAIYGVPVKRRELFGVLHLKGFVFDNTVLYSGASINNVYMGYKDRYRLDRYHEIQSQALSDTMCAFATNAFHPNFAVQDFSQGPVRPAKDMREEIKELRRHLTEVQYTFKNEKISSYEVGITPISGLGKRGNALNRCILWLLGGCKKKLFICTPYFNPPKILMNAIEEVLSKNIEITLVVGDKRANDFFIKDPAQFSTIGAIPYIYEQNLKRFMQKNQPYLENGSLKVMLWQDGDNTFHVKGMFVDRNYALITGNNLNPRAWGLDLENGLLITDNNYLMQDKFTHEQQYILRHTRKLSSADELENIDNYPVDVQKILKKVKRLRASILIKQLL